MNRICVVTLGLTVFFLSTAVLAADTDDSQKLNGVWKGYVVDNKGEKTGDRRSKIELTIKGNTITAIEDGKKELGEGTFTLKVSQDRNFMDATRTRGTGSRPGATYLGIYSLDGDTLKWCVGNPPGKNRPETLQTKTGQFLMIVTKQK